MNIGSPRMGFKASLWPPSPPRRASVNARFVTYVLCAGFITVAGWLSLRSRGTSRIQLIPLKDGQDRLGPSSGQRPSQPHPIETLIRQSEEQYQALLAKESHDVATAARHYRMRRGRHPPPGFAEWYSYATARNAVMVEEFFDQIHHDLNPFWGMSPRTIRQVARNSFHTISVRNHNVSDFTDGDRPWMHLWSNLVETIAPHLPDVDMPINVMDESRVVVPWETIDNYMHTSSSTQNIRDPNTMTSTFTGLADVDLDPGDPFDAQWRGHGPFWEVAAPGCPPNSPARNVPPPTDADLAGPPPSMSAWPPNSYHGYVTNWTKAKDPCLQPNISAMHATFIEPLSISTTPHLFPMFSGSKLPLNNDILIPPAMYWTSDPFYSGGDSGHGGPWNQKTDMLMWRGAASGGRNKIENWTRFQRHRFVAMANGTAVKNAETGFREPANFDLPDYAAYHLSTPRSGAYLGDWLDSFSDAAFVHLLCFPDEGRRECSYTSDYFEVKTTIPMAAQYKAKYLPDIDGNSFSGRYRGFLNSTSLPIKATIYSEWHDSRLVPWKHFVPMDNSFVDFYGIMEFFLGAKGGTMTKGGLLMDAKIGSRDGKREYDINVNGHDEEARKIALGGQEWANRVLRREDMQIYVYRLLLEYARVSDDERDNLGWVDDLLR